MTPTLDSGSQDSCGLPTPPCSGHTEVLPKFTRTLKGPRMAAVSRHRPPGQNRLAAKDFGYRGSEFELRDGGAQAVVRPVTERQRRGPVSV